MKFDDCLKRKEFGDGYYSAHEARFTLRPQSTLSKKEFVNYDRSSKSVYGTQGPINDKRVTHGGVFYDHSPALLRKSNCLPFER